MELPSETNNIYRKQEWGTAGNLFLFQGSADKEDSGGFKGVYWRSTADKSSDQSSTIVSTIYPSIFNEISFFL